MLTDKECIGIVIQQYNNAAGYFDHDFVTEGDRVSIKYFDDCTVVCDEGSHDVLNWVFNFQAIMIGTEIGGVEVGFNIGMADSVAHTAPLIPKDKTVYCIGHSRGAGRAYNRAARLIQLGYTVIVVVFGSPRPGDDTLAKWLSGATIHSYCNGKDPVCRVPFYIPKLAGFIEPSPFIMLDIPPAPDDEWGQEVGWHHSESYQRGVI